MCFLVKTLLFWEKESLSKKQYNFLRYVMLKYHELSTHEVGCSVLQSMYLNQGMDESGPKHYFYNILTRRSFKFMVKLVSGFWWRSLWLQHLKYLPKCLTCDKGYWSLCIWGVFNLESDGALILVSNNFAVKTRATQTWTPTDSGGWEVQVAEPMQLAECRNSHQKQKTQVI